MNEATTNEKKREKKKPWDGTKEKKNSPKEKAILDKNLRLVSEENEAKMKETTSDDIVLELNKYR